MTAVTNHLVNGICCLVRHACILTFPRVPVVHAPFDKTAKLLVLVVDELVTLLVVVLVWVLKVATSPHHNQKRERSDSTRFQGAVLGYGHLISDLPHLQAPNPMVCQFPHSKLQHLADKFLSPPKFRHLAFPSVMTQYTTRHTQLPQSWSPACLFPI